MEFVFLGVGNFVQRDLVVWGVDPVVVDEKGLLGFVVGRLEVLEGYFIDFDGVKLAILRLPPIDLSYLQDHHIPFSLLYLLHIRSFQKID